MELLVGESCQDYNSTALAYNNFYDLKDPSLTWTRNMKKTVFSAALVFSLVGQSGYCLSTDNSVFTDSCHRTSTNCIDMSNAGKIASNDSSSTLNWGRGINKMVAQEYNRHAQAAPQVVKEGVPMDAHIFARLSIERFKAAKSRYVEEEAKRLMDFNGSEA